MGFTGKAYLMAGLLFFISGYLASAKTVDQNRPAITILVYNTARVSPDVLAQSEQRATRIFREAGILTEWVECSSLAQACRDGGSNQFVLHIVPRGTTSTDTVFGVAFLATDNIGTYSDVFYDRMEKMYRDSGVNPAQLLATVAAHEIGHLLLGSHAHSAMGIMAARWQTGELRRISMGSLLFSAEQASRMRSRIEDRQKRGNTVLASTGVNE